MGVCVCLCVQQEPDLGAWGMCLIMLIDIQDGSHSGHRLQTSLGIHPLMCSLGGSRRGRVSFFSLGGCHYLGRELAFIEPAGVLGAGIYLDTLGPERSLC